MTPDQKLTALICLNAAEQDALDFPAIVVRLMNSGFESYTVDFRRERSTYYLPEGDYIEFPLHAIGASVAAKFDPAAIQAAILEAQTHSPGYTYSGFCRKVAEAGCAGYTVSFSGRRAVYSGRTGETHVEHFPT